MANEQNLRPITSTEQAREIGRIGGSRSTPRKRWAAQLRELKKKGLSDENYKKIIAIMEEPEASALDIFTFIQSIKADCKNANQKVLVAESLIRWHKAHHGEKIKTENVHHLINWEKILKECEISEENKV